jgi:hypothetical protein
MPAASGWFDTTAGTSIGSDPVEVRKRRSLRQCRCLETRTRVRYGAAASWISARIENRSVTWANSRRSTSTGGAAGIDTSMRMKNSPLCRSPNCWLSTMLPSRSTRKPETACTMPGRSGQESTMT